MEGPAAFASSFVPLWLGDRGRLPDFVHFGALAVADADGNLIAQAGNPELVAFLRSSAKPFQAIALLRRHLDDELGLTTAEIACACASHSGEDIHVAAARRILAAGGVPEDALRCGTHPPMTDGSAPRETKPIHNNCSGKHAAMLATCRRAGWPLEGYTEPDHPLQRENLETMAAFAGVEPEDVGLATDNCTVPTFALPLKTTARAFARLADPRGLDPDLATSGALAIAAMAARPDMVGGTGRLDTALIHATRGQLVVKTGANGFYAAVRHASAGRRAEGFALKLAGAEGEKQKAPIVIACLEAAGLLAPDEAATLEGTFDPPQRDCRGHVVGDARYVGDLRRG